LSVRGEIRVAYDEESELTRYVWRFGSGLRTRFESQVEQAAWAREKFAGATDEHGRRIMARYGRLDDTRINAALAGGLEAFRRSACRRILSEHPDLRVNRCPRCHRIVRTPAAKQCLRCGHDWHG
jgi:hypothetical protein